MATQTADVQLMTQLINCTFSPCRRYRYTWELAWNDTLPPCAFIGLNPSTADEHGPDPTVRRCINYAKRWGYGRLVMLNLFGFRATDRNAMKRDPAPIAHAAGPRANDQHLRRTVKRTHQLGGIVVAAWGSDGGHLNRATVVRTLLAPFSLHYLALTKAGEPGHPLYLKGDLSPIPWR